MHTLIGIAGSLRQSSSNHHLLEACTQLMPQGATLDPVRLAPLNVPLYNADIEKENGKPAGVAQLQERFAQADGIIIASPEYNGHYTGVLKNLLDWMSRPSSNQKGKHGLWDKPVAIISASPGPLGGIRQAPALRVLLSHLGMHVYPHIQGVGNCMQVLQDNMFTDEQVENRMRSYLEDFLAFATRFNK